MHLNSSGYVIFSNTHNYDREEVLMHRLLAVAEYGFDEVCGNVVHHRDNIPWDNRPENLEVLGWGEHSAHHSEEIDAQECDEMRSLYPHRTIERIADEYECGTSCVAYHIHGDCVHSSETHVPPVDRQYRGPRDGPWRDKSTFESLYVEKGLTYAELADLWDCSTATVSNWAIRHDISDYGLG